MTKKKEKGLLFGRGGKMFINDEHDDFDCTTMYAKAELSAEDMKNLSIEIAGAIQRRSDIEKEKAAVVADYAARMKESTNSIDQLARKIRDGFEMRMVDVLIVRDPKKRVVNYYKIENSDKGMYLGDLLRVRPMTTEDAQRELPTTSSSDGEPATKEEGGETGEVQDSEESTGEAETEEAEAV